VRYIYGVPEKSLKAMKKNPKLKPGDVWRVEDPYNPYQPLDMSDYIVRDDNSNQWWYDTGFTTTATTGTDSVMNYGAYSA